MANAENSTAKYQCPVCGYDEMRDPPDSGNICSCCGTEFDVDDCEKSHEQLRDEWIDNGLHWFSKATLLPKDWNPYRQLIDAGYGTDLMINPRFERDGEYRYAVDETFSNIRMARQLKTLRECHEPPLTQVQVAERAEMKQSRISELERVDYSSWSVSTLRRLARAMGVRFVFRFESWGALLPDVAGNFSRETLWVPSFEQDSAFHNAAARQTEPHDNFTLPSKISELLRRASPEVSPAPIAKRQAPQTRSRTNSSIPDVAGTAIFGRLPNPMLNQISGKRETR